MSLRREFVGHVLVDHGGVAVVDPVFVDTSDDDVERFCGAGAGSTLNCGEGLDVGVYVTTGLGDGHYPVYADVQRLPGAGERVARIVIDCLGVEPESDDAREQLARGVEVLRRHGINVRPDAVVDDEVRRRALSEEAAT